MGKNIFETHETIIEYIKKINEDVFGLLKYQKDPYKYDLIKKSNIDEWKRSFKVSYIEPGESPLREEPFKFYN